jgi:fructose-1,6-bisphosphatase/inositol monophosphatase family enzyme
MHPDQLLAVFSRAGDVARDAVGALDPATLRDPGVRPGQYAFDLTVDAAVLKVLHREPVRVVSEESGVTGISGAPITVVLDPIDGSTNLSRSIPYYAVALCAVDKDGPYVAYVRNLATGTTTTAIRGGGAQRDGIAITATRATDRDHAFLSVEGRLPADVACRGQRALGSAQLSLCDVAAGAVDAYIDLDVPIAPWDYLAGVLACREAGAVVSSPGRSAIDTTDPDARFLVAAAATPELLGQLRPLWGAQ